MKNMQKSILCTQGWKESKERRLQEKALLSDAETEIRSLIMLEGDKDTDFIISSVVDHIISKQECIRSFQSALFFINQGLEMVNKYAHGGKLNTQEHDLIKGVQENLNQLDDFVEQQYEIYIQVTSDEIAQRFVKEDLLSAFVHILDEQMRRVFSYD